MSELATRVRKRTLLPSGSDARFPFKFSVESFPGSKVWKTTSSGSVPMSVTPYASSETTWDEIHAGPPWTSGGPFKNIKLEFIKPLGAQATGRYITNGAGYVETPFGSGHMMYEGGFLPPGDWPLGFIDTDIESTMKLNSSAFPDMGHLDTPAWDKTKPKLEQGGLFVAIAELKDVPKMFQTTAHAFKKSWEFSHSLFAPNSIHTGLENVGNRIKRGVSGRQLYMAPKKAANHFINHNFGWVPFVKDLSDFLSNLRDFREKIGILSQNNGQWVRRRSILENVFSDEQVPGWSGTGIHNVYPLNTSPVNDTYSGTPHWEYRIKRSLYSTAVGSFRYYVPYFDVNSPEWGGLGSVRRQLALHGLRVSPSNIYKAVPWSWLIDWLTPVGHDLQVLQDQQFDNLVAKYLYATTHSTLELEFKQFVPFNAASGGPRTLTWTRTLQSKQRKGIDSPFGFGLTWDSLSPKQWAILAALGITRIT